MKKLNYDQETGRILGWYDETIHKVMPSPTVDISDEDWQVAINSPYNHYDITTGEFSVVDFRTDEQIAESNAIAESDARSKAMLIGTEYNGYMVSFTSEDGNGMIQVKLGFELGLVSTNIRFANGTIMPITAEEFTEFATWFVAQRNAFFVG